MGVIWDRKPARKSRIQQSPLKGDGGRAWPMEGAHLKIFGRFWSEQGDSEKKGHIFEIKTVWQQLALWTDKQKDMK